jgi:transposase
MRKESVMEELTTFVGLDVHKASITVAVAMERGEPFPCATIRNRPEAIRELVQKLGTTGTRYVYEAGPCGYALYRQLRALGADCVVAAPSKIERAPGQRVKTDRIDAQKLARQLRSGTIPAVWVPEPEDEALRDLTRARQTAQAELQRAKQRVSKLLLRLDLRPPDGTTAWTKAYRSWLQEQRLPFASQQVVLEEGLRAIEEAEGRVARLTTHLTTAAATAARAPVIRSLQAMRGIGLITASTLVAELGDITRFRSPRQLMSYAGLTPTEDSSGTRVRRGAISHLGNSHVRFMLGEMAWHHARPVKVGKKLRAQRKGQPPEIVELVQRADTRLHRRYQRLVQRGKRGPQAATAVAREALGFIWAVARQAQGLEVPPPRRQRAAAA